MTYIVHGFEDEKHSNKTWTEAIFKILYQNIIDLKMNTYIPLI